MSSSLETHLWIASIAHSFSIQPDDNELLCFFSWKDTWIPGEGGSNFYLRKREKEKTATAVYLTEDPKGLRSMQVMQNINHFISLYEDGTDKIHCPTAVCFYKQNLRDSSLFLLMGFC